MCCSRRCSGRYAGITVSSVTGRECRFLTKTRQQDLTCGSARPKKVQGFLATLRGQGLSVQTANFHLQAVKQFARWMVQDGRARESPIAHVKGGNVNVDRRHGRRAFGEVEFRRILETIRTGPTRFGITGPQRALLYRLAVETGFRAAEIRSLVARSFDLGGDPPTVTVAAAYSKRRRVDTQPILPTLASEVGNLLGDLPSDAPLFDLPRPDHVVKMFRADLQDTGIEYRDEDGRLLDFHALRHTFISNLIRGGVDPKVAQSLARHSTITLTMDRYSHTVMGQQAQALRALPDLSENGLETSQRATGTDDAQVLGISPGRLERRSPGGSSQTPDGTMAAESVKQEGRESQRSVRSHGHLRHSLSSTDRPNGEGGIRTRGTGLNPYDGLANRWFQPLTHLSWWSATHFTGLPLDCTASMRTVNAATKGSPGIGPARTATELHSRVFAPIPTIRSVLRTRRGLSAGRRPRYEAEASRIEKAPLVCLTLLETNQCLAACTIGCPSHETGIQSPCLCGTTY